MSISRSTFLVAVVVASAVTSAAGADDLATTVAERLKASGAVKGHRVQIDAKKDGTVILAGEVGDAGQLAAAEQIAKDTEGVERVANRLTVAKPAADVAAPSGGLLNAFAIPSSIRAAVGLGKTPKGGDGRDVQLTQAVGAVPGGSGPRPLGQAPARPLQPHAASRGPMGGQTVAMRQPMNLPGPGAYSGMVNEGMGAVNGAMGNVPGGLRDGQVVPGSIRYSENGAPVEGAPYAGGAPYAAGPGGAPPMGGPGGGFGAPMPARGMGVGAGAVPMRGDGPNMPNYAWPSYASYPNYAAVQYPTQYSPTAWPYIGPFYPYPQVPLGWRRVSLEWDDGWWWLDFDERHLHSHHR